MKPSSKTTKRTIKYLSVCNDRETLNRLVRNAPDAVIKMLCNVALNALKGDVPLSKSNKKLFRKHRQEITKLADRNVSLKAKRKLLVQRGGFAWIPAIIGAVVGALGSSIFGGASRE